MVAGAKRPIRAYRALLERLWVRSVDEWIEGPRLE
jgi:hypothetical protein